MRGTVPRFIVLALLSVGATCKGKGKSRAEVRKEWHKPPARPADMPETEPTREAAETPHPRIVLTKDKLKRIKAHAEAETELWRTTERACKRALKKDLSAGYYGAYWGRSVANLSTCWYGTGDETYAQGAIRYLEALVDDKRSVGDGDGGNEVVHGNSGYPIRNHGVFAALGYDWLYDAPGMTAELRKKIVARLRAWLDWYGEDGYLNYTPYSNYFWGYMSTLALSSLAVAGEAEVAGEWMKQTRDKLDNMVFPGFWKDLKGGEWTEGWQYGQLVAMEIALVVEGFRTATGENMSKSMPWLSEVVDSRIHELHPNKKAVYGNGTHGKNPPPPKTEALYASLLVLEDTDPDKAAMTRHLIHEDFPEIRRHFAWFGLIADNPKGMPRKDPRQGRALSYHLPGPGMTFARSSWAEDAYWVSFQAGPRISVDHQNADQGHFEMWRGADGLVIDGGAKHSQATINHNTILIDDGRKILRYSPSQGVWGKKVSTTHFFDDGKVVVAVGDLADAWSPKCVKRGCDAKGVDKAVRTWVYVRPNVVVIDDVISVTDSDSWVAWAAHLRKPPSIKGPRISSAWGSSRIDITRLLPDDATIEAPKEPTERVDHPFRDNRPEFDLWRLQTVTKKGSAERKMRHWLIMDDAEAQAVHARALSGEGLSGGIATVGEETLAVAFADAVAGGRLDLPRSGADTVVVAGLKVGEDYAVEKAPDKHCALSVAKSKGGSHTVNAGGFLRVTAADCK